MNGRDEKQERDKEKYSQTDEGSLVLQIVMKATS